MGIDGMVRRVAGLAALLAFGFAAASAAQEVPANMLIAGTVTAPSSVGLTLKTGFQVVVVREAGGATEGTGTLLDDAGTYAVDMSKTQAFNGTKLTLNLVADGRTYPLLSGTTPVSFTYSGGLFPVRLLIDATVGVTTSSSGGGSGGGSSSGGGTSSGGSQTSTATSEYAKFDVDKNGVFDERDVEIVKDVLVGRRPLESHPGAKLAGGAVVTTRDVILAIQALAQQRRRSLNATATSSTATTGGSGTSGSSGGASSGGTTTR